MSMTAAGPSAKPVRCSRRFHRTRPGKRVDDDREPTSVPPMESLAPKTGSRHRCSGEPSVPVPGKAMPIAPRSAKARAWAWRAPGPGVSIATPVPKSGPKAMTRARARPTVCLAVSAVPPGIVGFARLERLPIGLPAAGCRGPRGEGAPQRLRILSISPRGHKSTLITCSRWKWLVCRIRSDRHPVRHRRCGRPVPRPAPAVGR